MSAVYKIGQQFKVKRYDQHKKKFVEYPGKIIYLYKHVVLCQIGKSREALTYHDMERIMKGKPLD